MAVAVAFVVLVLAVAASEWREAEAGAGASPKDERLNDNTYHKSRCILPVLCEVVKRGRVHMSVPVGKIAR